VAYLMPGRPTESDLTERIDIELVVRVDNLLGDSTARGHESVKGSLFLAACEEPTPGEGGWTATASMGCATTYQPSGFTGGYSFGGTMNR
jgi:hypothetical protein